MVAQPRGSRKEGPAVNPAVNLPVESQPSLQNYPPLPTFPSLKDAAVVTAFNSLHQHMLCSRKIQGPFFSFLKRRQTAALGPKDPISPSAFPRTFVLASLCSHARRVLTPVWSPRCRRGCAVPSGTWNRTCGDNGVTTQLSGKRERGHGGRGELRNAAKRER